MKMNLSNNTLITLGLEPQTAISHVPCFEYVLFDIYIKDQFIRGIANDALQTDLLAKPWVLKSLDQNICHA